MHTVADLLSRGYSLTVYCANYRCDRNVRRPVGKAPKWKTLDLARFDPMTPIDSIKARLRCDVCQGKTVTIQVTPAGLAGSGDLRQRPDEA